ncbi:T9SS type A sorting domain-containing protein [Maribacter dokdonensis]|uniref:T9SS type A sorting domain-containing protein n=1 Tax=Maribacter dokdonensis TaxID=320912 RepID=UPI0007199747|nr:T9SS type A sorting domain-containing protein [Maribacter dokdonensis]KSA15229.1 hypothetical protein I600_1841 [Maribacter dokdonensis DSW-8]
MRFLFFVLLLMSVIPVLGQDNDISVGSSMEQTKHSINSGGGYSVGQEGNFSFSIGQIFTSQVFVKEGQILMGVQQGESSGSDNSSKIEIVAYPNPVTNKLFLSLGDLNIENISYSIFDFGGKLIQNEVLENALNEISFEIVTSGLYVIVIYQNDEVLKSLKIIKK